MFTWWSILNWSRPMTTALGHILNATEGHRGLQLGIVHWVNFPSLIVSSRTDHFYWPFKQYPLVDMSNMWSIHLYQVQHNTSSKNRALCSSIVDISINKSTYPFISIYRSIKQSIYSSTNLSIHSFLLTYKSTRFHIPNYVLIYSLAIY